MKLDDYIVNREWMLFPFKKIHPNFITVMGMASNILIIFFLLKGHIHLASLFLAIKFFCDCLDGAVARRYNKTSKLGGCLDTISDVTLLAPYCGVIVWLITENLTYAISAFFISLLVLIGYTLRLGTMHDHSKLKEGGNNVIKKSVEFAVNNSVLLYIIAIIFNETYLR